MLRVFRRRRRPRRLHPDARRTRAHRRLLSGRTPWRRVAAAARTRGSCPIPPVGPFAPRRSPRTGCARSTATGAVPSRAADHLFWLGRYAERRRNLRASAAHGPDPAEAIRRRPGVSPPSLLRGLPGAGAVASWRPRGGARTRAAAPVDPASASALIPPAHRQPLRRTDPPESRLQRAPDRPRRGRDPRPALVGQLAPAESVVRDGGRASRGLRRPPRRARRSLDQSIVSLVAVAGLEMAHMTRDDGWRFLSVGRHL